MIETTGKDPSLPVNLPPRESYEFPKGSLNLDFFSITNKGDRDGEIILEYPPYWQGSEVVVIEEKKTVKKGGKTETEKEEKIVVEEEGDCLEYRRYRLAIHQGAFSESISVSQTPVRVTNIGETLLVLGRN